MNKEAGSCILCTLCYQQYDVVCNAQGESETWLNVCPCFELIFPYKNYKVHNRATSLDGYIIG